MEHLLELRNVSKTYSSGLVNTKSTVALRDISLNLQENDPTILTVAGESGSGIVRPDRFDFRFLHCQRGDHRYVYHPDDETGGVLL